jgi:hypothetical protein
MALAISTQELQDFAGLLTASGITSIECNWRGFTCQFTEGQEEDAAAALQALRERVARIEGKDARKAFIERLSEATKDLATEQRKQHEARAAVRH